MSKKILISDYTFVAKHREITICENLGSEADGQNEKYYPCYIERFIRFESHTESVVTNENGEEE